MNPLEITILCLGAVTFLNPTTCLLTIPIIAIGIFILTQLND